MNTEELVKHSLKNIFDSNLPKEIYEAANREYIKIRMEDSGYEFPDDYMVLHASNKSEFAENVAAAGLHYKDKIKGKAKDFSYYLEKVKNNIVPKYNFNSDYNNFIRMRSEFCFTASLGDRAEKKKSLVAKKMVKIIHKTNFCYTDIREHYGFILTIPNISVNDLYQLHNLDGPAIDFKGGDKAYYINGRKADADIFENEITKEMFLSEENADRLAMMAAIVEHRSGENALFSLFDAEIVDQNKIPHGDQDEDVAIYTGSIKTDLGDQSVYWVQQICPSTGLEYYASIDKPENVVDAMKLTRDPLIPKELPYEWEGFRT